MENEIWKPIYLEYYKDKYLVSSHGNIKNKLSGKILSQHIRNGYKSVSLYYNRKNKTMNVHSLVANTFLEKRNNNNIVNHKNGNKEDNHLHNLEWTTYKKNTRHALDTGLTKTHPKKVLQYDIDGNFLNEFDSILKASERTGANDRHISAVCLGKRKTTGGYIWKYKENRDIILKCNGKIIKNFKNYMITKEGNVYSKRAKKFLVPKKLPSGYASVKLCNNGYMRDVYIHRLVAEAFIGNPDNKKWVNHKNGIRDDNHINNLEWMTHSENMIHSKRVLKFNL